MSAQKLEASMPETNDGGRLQRVESTLDAIKETLSDLKAELAVANDRYVREMPDLRDKVSRLDGRTSELERWKAWVLGAGAGVGMFSGVVSALLVHWLIK